MRRPWRVEYRPTWSHRWYCDSTHATEAGARAAKETRSKNIPQYGWRIVDRDAPVT